MSNITDIADWSKADLEASIRLAGRPVPAYTSDWYPETTSIFEVHRAGYGREPSCATAGRKGVAGYVCTHDALNGKDGQCPDCGSSVTWFHNLHSTRDGGLIPGTCVHGIPTQIHCSACAMGIPASTTNPYGGISADPVKPKREYTASEVEHGKSIARALYG